MSRLSEPASFWAIDLGPVVATAGEAGGSSDVGPVLGGAEDQFGFLPDPSMQPSRSVQLAMPASQGMSSCVGKKRLS